MFILAFINVYLPENFEIFLNILCSIKINFFPNFGENNFEDTIFNPASNNKINYEYFGQPA